MRDFKKRFAKRPRFSGGSVVVANTQRANGTGAVSGTLSQNTLVVQELLHKALESGHIHIFTQPVVTLPQRRIAFLETFTRIRTATPGEYLTPHHYRDLARREKLEQELDRLLLEETIEGLERLDALGKLEKRHRFKPYGGPKIKPLAPARFLNISPAALLDKAFINLLLDFAARRRDLLPYILFEMRQNDFNGLDERCHAIIAKLSALGCGFSLDSIEDLSLEGGDLAARQIHFLKVEARILLDKAAAPGGISTVTALVQDLKARNIGVIAEKIETETQLKDILDLGLDYGQGHYFGKPDFQAAYRNKVLGEAA